MTELLPTEHTEYTEETGGGVEAAKDMEKSDVEGLEHGRGGFV